MVYLPVPCVSIPYISVPDPNISTALPTIPPLKLHVTSEDNADIILPPVSQLATLDDVIQYLEVIIAESRSTVILFPEELLPILIELNDCSELESVRSQIAEHIIHMTHNLRTYLLEIPHCIILGPRSACKRLFASYLARIWKSLGQIRNESLNIIDHSDLVSELIGRYIGATNSINYQTIKRKLDQLKSDALMIEDAEYLSDRFISNIEVYNTLLQHIDNNPSPIIILDLKAPLTDPRLQRRFLWRFTLESEIVEEGETQNDNVS